MKLKHFIFLNQWIIFYSLYNYDVVEAIIGENVRITEEGEFSNVVSILHIRQGRTRKLVSHICSGTYITNSHVLTASHCLKDLLKNETAIGIGSMNTPNRAHLRIRWWITYNEWIESKDLQLQYLVNDIAIIKVRESLPDFIQPRAFTSQPNSYYYDMNVLIAGLSALTYNSPAIKKVTEVKVLPNVQCEERVRLLHGSRVPIHYRYLCSATEPFALLEHGDSGGPLLYGEEIIGVHTATVPKAIEYPHPGKVNIHTGIQYYREYILDVLSNNFQWS